MARPASAHWIASLLLAVGVPDPLHASGSLAVASSPWVLRGPGAVAGGGGRALETFWSGIAASGSPILERDPADPAFMIATFVYRAAGEAASAPAVYGPFDWDRTYPMRNITGSDVWVATVRLPSAYRGAYWLAWPRGREADPKALTTGRVDGQPLQELFDDPLARHHAPHFDSTSRTLGRYGWLEGPDAPDEPYLADRPGVPPGKLVTRVVDSVRLGNRRAVSVYTPPDYDPHRAGGYPLLLVFDREEYLSTVGAPRVLDRMIAARAIPPVIAVFVSAISDPARNRELPGDAAFQDFVHDELLPSLEGGFAISSRASQRIVGGASYGGLCAALLARRFPQSFGGVLAQSGAFWWGPAYSDGAADQEATDFSEAARLFANGPRLPIRFAMSVGVLEGDVMVQPNRRLRDVLVAKGYDVDYREISGAHDWISWRADLPHALVALLGDAAGR